MPFGDMFNERCQVVDAENDSIVFPGNSYRAIHSGRELKFPPFPLNNSARSQTLLIFLRKEFETPG
jgi:hypothetical protein